MRSVKPVRLWSDVPPHERVGELFLQTRKGWEDLKWRERRLRNLEGRPNQCTAAVRRISGGGLWNRCSHGAKPGSDFCPLHGGPNFRSEQVYKIDPIKRWNAMLGRAQEKRLKLKARLSEIDRKIATIQLRIAGIS